MAISASPSIIINEIDLSNVVTGSQSSTGGFVGNFQWGPVEEPKLIDNEKTLAATFGTPGSSNAVDFISATQFLSYSSKLYVNRVVTSAAQTSTTGAGSQTDLVVKNDNDYETKRSSFTSGGVLDTGPFIARYPGELGNTLAVSVFPAAQSPTDWAAWTYKSAFDGEPGTSPWLGGFNDSDSGWDIINDELHIAVIDVDGLFSGTRGTVLETFPYTSTIAGAKTVDGGNNYWIDVINNNSQYIRFGYKSTSCDVFLGDASIAVPETPINYDSGIDYSLGSVWTNNGSTYRMQYGAASGALSANEIAVGFDAYEDVDILTVDLLIAPSMDSALAQQTVVSDLVQVAAQLRRDCVVISSPPRSAMVVGYGAVANPMANILSFAASVPSSSYLVLDNQYVKVFDKYNDRYIWIPAASTTAGIMAATDLTEGPWFSPAGQKRGQYYGILDIVYNPTKNERDQLYALGVNPIVNLPGRGTTLYGDKTKESRPSAFNRINVRRLFLHLERAISIAARGVMFEFNDEFTRAEFVNIVEPFLREIKGRRGITDFVVQCDETNNPPSVVDNNQLIASIFVKPARSINFVTLNFVAVRSGVSFEEVIGTV